MKILKGIVRYKLYIVVFGFLNLLLSFYLYKDKSDHEKLYFQQKIEKLKSELSATTNAYNLLADFTLGGLSFDPEFLETLGVAVVAADGIQKAHLRELVRQKLIPIFKRLQNYGFLELYIILPDGTVFLRAHNPEKFGDKPFNADAFADSIIAQKNPKKTIESEFVYIFPLFYKNTFIGSLRTTIPLSTIKNELSKIFYAQYDFILKKEAIWDTLGGQKLFVQSDLDADYFHEKTPFDNQEDTDNISIAYYINNLIREEASKKLDAFEDFALAVRLKEQWYIATFVAISNTSFGSKEKIGYLISYLPDTTFKIFDTTFLSNLIFGNLLIFSMMALVFYIDRTNERLKRLAITDPLTGIHNRNMFNKIIDSEIPRARRYERPLAFIIFDVDHFKKINDTFGHDIGDYVLKTIASIVKKTIRQSDHLIRWGGEEFVVLAPETDLLGAVSLAEKIRQTIESHHFEKNIKVTISAGVAKLALPSEDIDSLAKRADEALYIAKERGRNRVVSASLE